MYQSEFVWGNLLSYAKPRRGVVKFIYSEKATKFCEITTLLLSFVVPVKSKVEISQNFVAFSEYMNFTIPGELVGYLCPSVYVGFKNDGF